MSISPSIDNYANYCQHSANYRRNFGASINIAKRNNKLSDCKSRVRIDFVYRSKVRSDVFYVLSGFLLALLHFLLLFGENDPVILVVILVAVSGEKVLEHVLHGAVLGTLVESQVSALAEVLGELDGVSLAEDLDRSGQLLLLDSFVLVPLVVGLESLPREHASEEVHHHVADALHVIPAR